MEKEKLLHELKKALLDITTIFCPDEIQKLVYKDGYEDTGEGLIAELRKIRRIKHAIYEADMELTLRTLTVEEIEKKKKFSEYFEQEQKAEENRIKKLETLLSKVTDYLNQTESVRSMIINSCSYLDLNWDSMNNAPYLFFWLCNHFGYKNTIEEIKKAIEIVYKFYNSGDKEIEKLPKIFLGSYDMLTPTYMSECYYYFKMPYFEREKIQRHPYQEIEFMIADRFPETRMIFT